MILDSSMVEHSAVNRVVVGSSPTRGAGSEESKVFISRLVEYLGEKNQHFVLRV